MIQPPFGSTAPAFAALGAGGLTHPSGGMDVLADGYVDIGFGGRLRFREDGSTAGFTNMHSLPCLGTSADGTVVPGTCGGGGGGVTNPLVITNGSNSLTFTVPPTGNPVMSSTSGSIDIASLFVTNLAGSGVSCLQTDASGNVTRTGAACGVGSGAGTINPGAQGFVPFYTATGTGTTLGPTTDVTVDSAGILNASGGLTVGGGNPLAVLAGTTGSIGGTCGSVSPTPTVGEWAIVCDATNAVEVANAMNIAGVVQAPNFIVSQNPLTNIQPLRAGAKNAKKSIQPLTPNAALEIQSSTKTNFLDFFVHDAGDPMIDSATHHILIHGLKLANLTNAASLATDANGEIIAGTGGGNADTATQFLGTPTQCGTGLVATGIQRNGNANCTSGGGGGPSGGVSISDLLDATHDHTIESGDNYNEIASHFSPGGGGYTWLLWDSSNDDNAVGHQLSIWNRGNNLVVPFDVSVSSNGWMIQPRTGNLVPKGTSKLGPLGDFSGTSAETGTVNFNAGPTKSQCFGCANTSSTNTGTGNVTVGSGSVGNNTANNITGNVIIQPGASNAPQTGGGDPIAGNLFLSPGTVASTATLAQPGGLNIMLTGSMQTPSTNGRGRAACVSATARGTGDAMKGPRYEFCTATGLLAYWKWVGTMNPGGNTVSIYYSGQAPFTSSALQSWTAGAVICLDTANPSYFISNGNTVCAAGEQAGIVTYTDSSAQTIHYGVILRR